MPLAILRDFNFHHQEATEIGGFQFHYPPYGPAIPCGHAHNNASNFVLEGGFVYCFEVVDVSKDSLKVEKNIKVYKELEPRKRNQDSATIFFLGKTKKERETMGKTTYTM
ncbi:hypothetical protein JTE90_024073 [Oedothorax gibbosus]|uniref:Uncharacterized protein n=1 Tax=Oedothorax gibbosus TaxID=931172 RepID=A0AAV6U672_9ARAC|nr:hypothetical protein JTE90_024073 [Oedothorax gibbosus]